MSAHAQRKNDVASQLAGLLLLAALWEAAGSSHLFGAALPPIATVARVYALPWKRALLLRAASASLTSAGIGLVAGTALGLAVASLAHLVRRLEPGLDRLAVVANAAPAVALGPILIITAGREATPAMLAAIPVFFLIYVAFSTGLRSTDPITRRYLVATGASPWRRFLLLDATAALPSLMGGLKVSVTTAMIGTIVGEWFGAPAGLGIVLLNTMQNFQIPLMWATVLVVAGISLAAYSIVAGLEHWVTRRITG